MADVQPTDWTINIQWQYFEALTASGIPRTHLLVCLAVIRKTWGWNKLSDSVAISQICTMTSCDDRNVRRAIKDLIGWNMLTDHGRGYRGALVLGPQKDFDQWRVSATQNAENKREKRGQPRAPQPGVGGVTPGASTRAQAPTPGASTPGANDTDPGRPVQNDRAPQPSSISNLINKQSSQELTAPSGASCEELFEWFWMQFPKAHRGRSGSKKRALAEFKKLKVEAEAVTLMAQAAIQQAEDKTALKAASPKDLVPVFQDVERWIKNRRWEDERPEIPTVGETHVKTDLATRALQRRGYIPSA